MLQSRRSCPAVNVKRQNQSRAEEQGTYRSDIQWKILDWIALHQAFAYAFMYLLDHSVWVGVGGCHVCGGWSHWLLQVGSGFMKEWVYMVRL